MSRNAEPTSWRMLAKRSGADVTLGRPAKESAIVRAESVLGLSFPESLRELLSEADGVVDEYGSRVIWPVAEIDRQNRAFRTDEGFRGLYMPFDSLLFFGEDGGGDQFAFAIHADGKVHKHDVFRWQHETDARTWYAPRLAQFLERRLRSDAD